MMYFSEHEDYCMSLADWKEYAEVNLSNEIDEIKLFKAEIEYGTGYFWCDVLWEIGESGEGCGKECVHYKPRNGKNGRCKFHKSPYNQTDKVKTIKL